LLGLLIYRENRDSYLFPFNPELVHPDYALFARLHFLLKLVGALTKQLLYIPFFYSRYSAPLLIHLGDDFPGHFFHLVGHRLNGIGSCQWIHIVSQPCLMGHYLLDPQGCADSFLGGNAQCLVMGGGGHPVNPSKGSHDALDGNTGYVVKRLLGRKGARVSIGVNSQRRWFFCSKALNHKPCP